MGCREGDGGDSTALVGCSQRQKKREEIGRERPYVDYAICRKRGAKSRICANIQLPSRH
jgi:hypothetical protein